MHLLKYRVANVNLSRIGHTVAELFSLKEEINELGLEYKFIVPIDNKNISNKVFLQQYENDFIFVKNKILNYLIKSSRNKFLFHYDVDHFILNPLHGQSFYYYFQKNKFHYKLPNLDKIEINFLKLLNFNFDKWFVCFHARNPNFSPLDSKMQAYRNNSLENYKEAINFILDSGGQCVVLGNSYNQEQEIKGVIHYNKSKFISPKLDWWLCANARLFVGNTSGLHFLATISGTPLALTNLVPMSCIPYKSTDRYIPKLLKDLNTGKLIPLDLMMSEIYQKCRTTWDYEEKNIHPLENNSHDILQLIKESIEITGSNKKIKVTDDQIAIKNLFKKCHYGFEGKALIGKNFAKKYL